MTDLINIYENKNRMYSYSQTENAYIQLNNYYKPLVLNLKKQIKQLNDNILSKKKDIEKNKKQYYYYYNKYKKL
jgi:hypothetical protein